MLTLTDVLSAASMQRGDTAKHWLDEAQRIGAQVADTPTDNWQQFSPTNVTMWRTSIGVERGEGGTAVLGLAKAVNVDLLEPKSSRRAGFLLDVGRGLAQEPRTRAEAVRWLRRAEDAAPPPVRNSVSARETG